MCSERVVGNAGAPLWKKEPNLEWSLKRQQKRDFWGEGSLLTFKSKHDRVVLRKRKIGIGERKKEDKKQHD